MHERARLRAEQREIAAEMIRRYNRDAVICVGVPFGHTRPQWILPHGGMITVDGVSRTVTAEHLRQPLSSAGSLPTTRLSGSS